jgi:hypothetical protein
MQYDKDLLSEHKELFLQAREFLLSFDGIQETNIEILWLISPEKCMLVYQLLRSVYTRRFSHTNYIWTRCRWYH